MQTVKTTTRFRDWKRAADAAEALLPGQSFSYLPSLDCEAIVHRLDAGFRVETVLYDDDGSIYHSADQDFETAAEVRGVLGML